ncbi:MAG TPA: tetratricopeptide repeat protein [Thermoanaerobaculia bacterium]|nr:tetratricopeptide repeat protein [Thermoanaerobaculia bacterium]
MRIAAFVLLSLVASASPAQLVENVTARSDSTQTYTLFLPKSYDGKTPHPVLLVFDPRSRGTKAAQFFVPAAEEYGWIVISSNQTRSDGSHEPNERAIRALLPELGRYAVDANRIYAAGFSGTAMMAWGVGIATGRLAGVIGVGGRFVPELPPSKFNFAHYGFAGVRDFNNREMRMVDAALESSRVPHRFQQFDGEHQWMPPALAREALGWFEALAGRHVDQVFAEDVAAAAALNGLEALRRYRAIARTYSGRALPRLAALEADASVRRERAEEKKWDAFEAEYVSGVYERMPSILAAPDTVKAFRVPDLRRRATRPGAEGAAARRLLESVYAQTAFYLMQQLMARREYSRAAAVLGVAVQIHPERWDAWYNLAAAEARAGNRKQALTALEKAVAAGFHDAKQLASDDDFAALRGEERFRNVLASASQ